MATKPREQSGFELKYKQMELTLSAFPHPNCEPCGHLVRPEHGLLRHRPPAAEALHGRRQGVVPALPPLRHR